MPNSGIQSFVDASKAQGAPAGGGCKKYMVFSKCVKGPALGGATGGGSLKGGAQGDGAGGGYLLYVDHQNYMKNHSQGGGAGGDFLQDVDFSKYMQGHSVVAVGDGNDAFDKRADDRIGCPTRYWWL